MNQYFWSQFSYQKIFRSTTAGDQQQMIVESRKRTTKQNFGLFSQQAEEKFVSRKFKINWTTTPLIMPLLGSDRDIWPDSSIGAAVAGSRLRSTRRLLLQVINSKWSSSRGSEPENKNFASLNRNLVPYDKTSSFFLARLPPNFIFGQQAEENIVSLRSKSMWCDWTTNPLIIARWPLLLHFLPSLGDLRW